MKITVTTTDDQIFNLEISEDLELENFKAFCEVESGVPSPEILIVASGRPLVDDKKSLKDLGLKDGDVVMMQRQSNTPNNRPLAPTTASTGSSSDPASLLPQFDFSNIQVPTIQGRGQSQSTSNSLQSRLGQQPNMDDPATIRDILLNDPEQMALVQQNNPSLAEALKKGDFVAFSKMIQELQAHRQERENQRRRLLAADPFDLEAQRLIAEEIRQKNVEANMEAAMEYNPESFGTVVMLYINCKVNGRPVKAFVDSGAQTTIMSAECAERCHIMRLVDTRFAGIAKGVGTQKILGRVHMTQIQIGNDFLTSSFSILEDQSMDMLLGLDMLKRHQCMIDLKRNLLVIGTTATETPFLPESELPDLARLTSSKSTLAEEQALSEMGEDLGLAKALEASVKDQHARSAAAAAAEARASSSSSSSSTSNPGVQPGDNFNEATVQEIVKLGFPREQVIFELRRFNGDKTQAIAALFAKSLKF